MDESHHYRAERGMQVINELNLCIWHRSDGNAKDRERRTRQFKNVSISTALGRAMDDGFVKEPVATRKDFDPSLYAGRTRQQYN